MTTNRTRRSKSGRDPSPPNQRRLLDHPILSIDEELRLGLMNRMTGDREALDKLVRHNLRFAAKLAQRYSRYGVDFDDLFQQANLGLIEAAESYDPARGYRFISYAVWHIRNNIFAELNNRHLIKRSSYLNDRVRAVVNATTELFAKTGHEPSAEELAKHLGLSVAKINRAQGLIEQSIVYLDRHLSAEETSTYGDVLPDASTISAEVYLLAHNELNLLVRWLERVAAAARQIAASDCRLFLYRYGLDDGSYELRPMKDVAAEVGLSPERVGERLGSAIRKVRHIGVGSPLSEERLEFEIRRAFDIREALADRTHADRLE